MAVTRASFIVMFPEFSNSNVEMVEAHLASAALEIDSEVWGDKADVGTMYLAAHRLSLSPYGNNAEMVSKGGVTTYQVHYQALQRQVSSGYRVA